MLRIKGRLSSTAYRSEENLLRILPTGVRSKKDIGALSTDFSSLMVDMETFLIQDDKKKSGVISHPIKSVLFVQIQNRFGFSKNSLGDARC